MSDLFHKDVLDDYIKQVFEVMNKAHWHTFQVLTKRAERISKVNVIWSDNIWMDVSIESNQYVYRADYLRNSKANIKFLSIEPLIGSVNKLDYANLDWIIVVVLIQELLKKNGYLM